MPVVFKESGNGWITENAVRTTTDAYGTVVDEDYATNNAKYEYSFCQGETIPDFHKRKISGELLPMTPWKQFFGSGEAHGVFAVNFREEPQPNWSREGISPYMPYSTKYMPTLEDLEDALVPYDYSYYVQKAAAKLYSDGHDTATFLAEIAKTRELLLGAFRDVLRLLSTGRLPPALKRELWGTPGKWLEARYGWRTLLYDVESLNEAIKSLSESDAIKIRSERAGQSTEWSNSWITYQTLSFGSAETSIVETFDVSVRGSVAADIKPPTFSFNLVVTAWELVPFSFVFDWFINVGQWLASMSFILFSEKSVAAGGYKITKTRTQESQMVSWNTDYSGTREIASYAKAELVLRIPTGIPTIPLTKVRLDEFKYLDLVSLIYQQFGK